MSTHIVPALMYVDVSPVIHVTAAIVCADTVEGTNPAMVDTRSRTMARSVSPMLQPWPFYAKNAA